MNMAFETAPFFLCRSFSHSSVQPLILQVIAGSLSSLVSMPQSSSCKSNLKKKQFLLEKIEKKFGQKKVLTANHHRRIHSSQDHLMNQNSSLVEPPQA